MPVSLTGLENRLGDPSRRKRLFPVTQNDRTVIDPIYKNLFQTVTVSFFCAASRSGKIDSSV